MTSRCGAAKGTSPGGVGLPTLPQRHPITSVHQPTDSLLWLSEPDGESEPRGTDLWHLPLPAADTRTAES